MAIEDDDKPRKKVTHEIGQDLSLLSVEELAERIALMTSEIERLQAAMTKKRASKDAAEQLFQVVKSRRPGRGAARAGTQNCGSLLGSVGHLASQNPAALWAPRSAGTTPQVASLAPASGAFRHTRPMADMANESLKEIARLRSIKLSRL